MSNGINFRVMAVDLRGQLTDAQSELAAERLRADTAVADANDAERKLAALREELAKRPSEIAMSLQTKLKAAEQRNAELEQSIVALPDEFKELSGCENTAGVYACIDYISDWVAELAKPTESGASE